MVVVVYSVPFFHPPLPFISSCFSPGHSPPDPKQEGIELEPRKAFLKDWLRLR